MYTIKFLSLLTDHVFAWSHILIAWSKINKHADKDHNSLMFGSQMLFKLLPVC